MISVQWTIAGANFENIKVRIQKETVAEVFEDMAIMQTNANRLFRNYERLVEVRDMGHQEAVEAVVQGLGAVVVEEAPAVQPEAAEGPSKPFWDKSIQEQAVDSPTPAKPWERKQSSPEPAAPTAGQSVNLL